MPDFIAITNQETSAKQDVGVIQIWIDPNYPEAHRDRNGAPPVQVQQMLHMPSGGAALPLDVAPAFAMASPVAEVRAVRR
jgi:hypothetical protein